MKKIFAFMLVAALFFTACANNDNTSSSTGDSAVSGTKQQATAQSSETAGTTADSAVTSHIYGNTQGNLSNRGLTAESGSWTYVSLNGILRENNDAVQLVTDDSAEFLNVIGGWVYYCNTNEDNTIYKIRTDGTERAKISDDKCRMLWVVDDWCYYTANDEEYHSILYRIKTDGTGKTSLYADGQVSNIVIQNGYIYFTDYNSFGYNLAGESSNPPPNPGLYRIKTDGSGLELLYSDKEISSFQIADNMIFCEGEDETPKGYFVAAMKSDGTDFTALDNADWMEQFNIYDGWIFYAEDDALSNSVYKMRLDGSEKTLLFDNSADPGIGYAYLNIANDWLYIGTADWEAKKIRFDGLSPQPWSRNPNESEYFSLNTTRRLDGYEMSNPSQSDKPSYFIEAQIDNKWIMSGFNAFGSQSSNAEHGYVCNDYFMDFDNDGNFDGCITINTDVPNYQNFSDANFNLSTDLVTTDVTTNSRYGWNVVEYNSVFHADSSAIYVAPWNVIYSKLGYTVNGKETYFYKGTGNIGVGVYLTYINDDFRAEADSAYNAVRESVMFVDENRNMLVPGDSPAE